MSYAKHRDRKNNFIFAVGADMASQTGITSKPSASWWHWCHEAELTFSVAIIVIHSTSNIFSVTACLPDELLHPSTSSILKLLLTLFFFKCHLTEWPKICLGPQNVHTDALLEKILKKLRKMKYCTISQNAIFTDLLIKIWEAAFLVLFHLLINGEVPRIAH